jgi:LysR family transcriptional regulator, regulator of gene expression of beta-lactamase
MDRPNIPFNALRAFEAAARHLTLSRAAVELCVTQAALSHQIRNLEERLGVTLFRRVPRGLVLTDEGAALVPVLTSAFDTISERLDRFSGGQYHETLNVGVVGTFATGWLVPRLTGFEQAHPEVDLRLFTNNNRVNIPGEGLDLAIRFGNGAWHGMAAQLLMQAPMTAMCAPAVAAHLHIPSDLRSSRLLRSYRPAEWEAWFGAQQLPCPILRGPLFDSSLALADMAAQGHGVALLPQPMFRSWQETGRLVQPFSAAVDLGAYWLLRAQARPETAAMRAFGEWLQTRMHREKTHDSTGSVPTA